MLPAEGPAPKSDASIASQHINHPYAGLNYGPMLNKPTDHLLSCAAEEAVEIGTEMLAVTQDLAKVACKSLRFGAGNVRPSRPDGGTNAERLVDELNDMLAVADMLAARGVIPKTWRSKEKQKAKKEKVWRLYQEALARGSDG